MATSEPSAASKYHDDVELQALIDSNGIDEVNSLPLYKESEWHPIRSQSGSFIGALEGLRGIAVCLTCYGHIIGDNVLSNVLGSTGVTIFFVLSGFLITGILIRLNYDVKRGYTPFCFNIIRQFYIDRFVRLGPSLFFMVPTVLALFYCTYGYDERMRNHFREALLSLTYTTNIRTFWKDGDEKGIFFNTWSLAVEAQYYLFWSLIVPLILRLSSRGKFMVLTSLISASFLMFILACIYRGFIFDYYISLPTNIYKMLIGSLLQLVPMPPFVRKPFFTYAGLFGIAAMITVIWRLDALPYYQHFQSPKAAILTLTDPLTTVITVSVICGLHGRSSSNFFLDNSILRFFGKFSYALYLFQYPLMLHSKWPHGTLGFAVTSLAFALAQLSTLFIEQPIRYRYSKWKANRDH